MTTLHWKTPAARWTEAAPVGNGAIGALVLGDPRGRIVLNDSSLWSGTPETPARALQGVLAGGAGPERLEEVRRAVSAQDDDEAEALLRTFEGPWSQEFLPLGDLDVELGEPDRGGYERMLDLEGARVTEAFTVAGVPVRRTTWASAPDAALVVEVEAERPVDMTLRLRAALRVTSATADGGAGLLALLAETPVDGAPKHEPDATAHVWDADGAAARGFDPAAAVAAAVSSDGEISAAGGADGADGADGVALHVSGATRLRILLVTETNARRWWQGEPTLPRADLLVAARDRVAAATTIDPGVMRARHAADVAALLGRSRLEVGGALPDDVDVAELLAAGDDRVLAGVLFAFGRYLLVSASRPGSPPANLQGIWNAALRPAWSSNYTININTEMNYWVAERTGLGEVHEPLLDLVRRVADAGRDVARELYGARGWVAHHNTDPWGYALPVGAGHSPTSWAFWPMGGLWLADHLWQHWEHGRDEADLAERTLPILLGASEFALDWLVEEADGLLGTNPSTAPENHFRRPDGTVAALGTSSAMDLSLVRATFERTLAAADTVGAPAGTAPLLDEIRTALDRLAPLRLATDGTIAEWSDDAMSSDPQHRHLSHLVGLYPLHEIDVVRTPELAQAVRRSLDVRGNGAMGWSWSWKIALRARLGQGEVAHSLLREAVRPYDGDPDVDGPVDGSLWGGLLPSLFSTHPPFQIDGNFGLGAALVEMLVGDQTGSDDDPLRLLPALPSAWPDGSVTGIRTRGGVDIDLEWSDGRPRTVRVVAATAAAPARLTMTFGDRREVLPVDGRVHELDGVPS